MDYQPKPRPESIVFSEKEVTDKPVFPPQRKRETDRETERDRNCERQKRQQAEKETDGYFPHSVCPGNVMCDCLTQVPNLYLTSTDEKRQMADERYSYKMVS